MPELGPERRSSQRQPCSPMAMARRPIAVDRIPLEPPPCASPPSDDRLIDPRGFGSWTNRKEEALMAFKDKSEITVLKYVKLDFRGLWEWYFDEYSFRPVE